MTIDDKSDAKDEKLDNISKDKVDDEKKVKRYFYKKNYKEPHNLDPNDTIDCISKVIGNYGPYQKKFVIYYMLIYLISPFQNYGIVFYGFYQLILLNDHHL